MGQIIAMLFMFIVGLAGSLVASFLLSWPVFMLWNGCLFGAIAGVAKVTWLQAWGISILCSFLFRPIIKQAPAEKAK